jgi:GNAT superfamily N-acetyltransferase
MSRLSSFERPLWFGYFFAYTDRYAPDSPDVPQNVTVVADEPQVIARAAAHVPVIIGGSAQELEAARPVWHRVVALFVSEESSVAGLENAVQQAREDMAALGCGTRPIVAYATAAQRDADDWRVPAGADWLAPELYVDPAHQNDGDAARAHLMASADEWARRTPRRVPWLIVAQAYDRNGHWTNRETLLALQDVYAELLHRHRRARGVLLFAANRPGGVRDHRVLLAAHERLFDAIPGAPEIR